MLIDHEIFIKKVKEGLIQYRQAVQAQRQATPSPLEYIRLNAIDATAEAISDYLDNVVAELLSGVEEPGAAGVKEPDGDPQLSPEELERLKEEERIRRVKSGEALQDDLDHVMGHVAPGDMAYDITEKEADPEGKKD